MSNTKSNSMEQRVSRLELRFKIAFGVATVLGFSCAYVHQQLREAQAQATELEAKFSRLDPMVTASIARIQEAANTELRRIADLGAASSEPASVSSVPIDSGMPSNRAAETSVGLVAEAASSVSMVEVVVAQNYAKDILKLERFRACKNVRPEEWHRAQTLYGRAEDNKQNGHYGQAVDEFKKARTSAESCAEAAV